MTIYTEVRTGQSVLENIEAPYSDVLGASMSDALINSPTSALFRMLELDRASDPKPPPTSIPLETEIGAPPGPGVVPPLVPADEARTRLKQEGLEKDLKVPDIGIRSAALDILITRKLEEKRRRDVLSRGPSGVLPTVGTFSAGVVASMFDPLNVASAFVPVVGPTRYAAMVARAGSRVGVRAGVGAVEGAAGAALVEPIVLAAASQEQADYDITDSLLNMAFGTVLGGGLHVGVGAAADAVARRRGWQQAQATDPLPQILETVPQETREAALRTGVAQAMSGRQVDIEPIVQPVLSEPPPPNERSLMQYLRSRGGLKPNPELNVIFGRTKLDLIRKDGMSLDEARAAAVEGGYLSDIGDRTGGLSESTINDFLTALDTESRGSKLYPIGAEQPDAVPRLERDRLEADLIAEIQSLGDDYNKVPKRMRDRALYLMYTEEADAFSAFERAVMEADFYGERQGSYARVETNRIPDDSAGTLGTSQINQGVSRSRGTSRGTRNVGLNDQSSNTEGARSIALEQAQQAARESFEPENASLVDIEAVRAADETIRSAPANDDAAAALTEVTEDVRSLARSLGDEELMARELKPFDDLDKTADEYGKALRAAAGCGLRRG